MTTIAICSEQIAADGRQCMGSELIRDDARKIQVRGNVIYATTGEASASRAAIEWHMSGAKAGEQPHAGKDDGWRLIVVCLVDKKPTITLYGNDMPHGINMPFPQAYGSGSSYAMAALDLGFSAKVAVEAAAKRDVFTGGAIQVVNIRSVLFAEGDDQHDRRAA